MSEPENNTTPTQPVFPPIDATKAVPPVTPFPAWTWNTPVIPQFYWNVYSSEQRIRQICVEIGRIQAYLEYFAANSNAAHWYLDNRFTQVETRLTARVDKLEKELGEEVARLDKALADETKNRVDGDKALQAQIDATKTALEAETAAREAGDDANAKAIAKETADREAGDGQLADDLATETNARANADTALGGRIDAEATARQDADTHLGGRIVAETNARANADTALGGRIDAEATARQDADTHLGERIVAEHTERAHDVQTLTTGMNRRPLATAITAKEGSGVTVESKETDDGSGTGVVIGSTWQGDFTAMRNDLTAETAARTNADSALEAKLDAETSERRHDDAEQDKRIDGKLAFGAVRAGDGITVVNDPDTTTATVSAEVTKAKLDEAIAGIPGYELPTATANRLGGVKVGTGLTVTDDGTLNATPATGTKPGVVRPVQGLAVWDDGSLYVKHGNGLTFNSSNELEPKLGNGLIFSGDRVQANTGRGFRFVAGALEPNLGDGLAFSDNGAITATGAAGTSESVKVVYPQATQTALGVHNTSGQLPMGTFLNLFAGVDPDGSPVARFNVKYVEITKGHFVEDAGRNFDASDFKTVTGGVFNGCYVFTAELNHLLHTANVFGPDKGGNIAAIVHAITPGDSTSTSIVCEGSSIMTFIRTSMDEAALANAYNSANDTLSLYGVYCIDASPIPRVSDVLDIHSNN